MYDRWRIVPVVLALLLLAASIAGCTVSIPGLSQSHVQAFVTAMHDNTNANQTPNEEVRSWQEISEGSDTIRIRYDIYNSSSTMTTTYDFRVKEFQKMSDATNFVNGMNEGYVTATSSVFGTATADNSAYTKVMGHNSSKTDAYMAVDGLIPPKARFIVQMDEFVVYGSATGLTGLSGSAAPTPTTPASITSNEKTSGDKTTFSSSSGFSITYPKTLKTDSTTNASVQVRIYVYLATNNTVNAVNVATEPVDPKATSLDYKNFNIEKITDYPNYQLISTDSTTVAGKPAYTVVWQATIPVQVGSSTSNIQDTPLKVMQTYLVNNNNGYVVTYKAIPSDYNTYLAQAQQIMNSFTLN